MKKLLFIGMTFLVTLITSCSTENNEVVMSGEKTVSVSLGGDFVFESFTRSSSTLATTAEDIWIFDYMDGKHVQTVHKVNGDDPDFWNPEITLDYGKHNLYFLLSSGENPNIMEQMNIISWGNTVGDTFWAKQELEVGEETGTTLSVWMNRVVTLLKIKSSDIIPENAKLLELVPAEWNHGINYLTGEPEGLHQKQSITYELTDQGSQAEILLYGFAKNTEKTTDINFYSRSSKTSVIKSFTIKNIPYKVNRITSMTGLMFSEKANNIQGSYGMYANTAWLTEYELTW